MIDRKALWIFIAVLLAMTGASIWQISLLPDWRHMPLGGPASHNTVSGLILFASPASVLLFMVSPFILWIALRKEALPSLQRWNGKWIISMSVFMAVCQALALAYSLGLVSPSRLDIARGGSVMIGIMFMIMGNLAPKMPVPPRRSSVELDSWNANRMLRFAGKLFVGLGLAFVIGGILLPLEHWEPLFGSLMVTALAAGIWYHIKLRHERSLQVRPDDDHK